MPTAFNKQKKQLRRSKILVEKRINRLKSSVGTKCIIEQSKFRTIIFLKNYRSIF